jgi:hypothetical protein
MLAAGQFSVHAPAMHAKPAAHAWPQPPQFVLLVIGSTHRPAHVICVPGQPVDPSMPVIGPPTRAWPVQPEMERSASAAETTSRRI